MKTIEIAWKEWNMDLQMVDARIREILEEAAPGEKYNGNSADLSLRLHFTDVVTDEEIAEIQAYLDAIDEASEEVTEYRTAAQIQAALESMRAAIPAKTWANMSAAERGILIGIMPTKAQLIAAELL